MDNWDDCIESGLLERLYTVSSLERFCMALMRSTYLAERVLMDVYFLDYERSCMHVKSGRNQASALEDNETIFSVDISKN